MTRIFNFISLIFVIGCTHQFDLGPTDIFIKEELITLYGSTLKDGGDRFKIKSVIKNDHKESIIILMDDLTCFRGKTEGKILGPTKRHMYIKSGESKNFQFYCELPFDIEAGDFKIIVKTVYNNVKADEKSAGDVVGENLEWVIKNR